MHSTVRAHFLGGFHTKNMEKAKCDHGVKAASTPLTPKRDVK